MAEYGFNRLQTTMIQDHPSASSPALVSCDWLQQNRHHPKLRILDASFFLPRQRRHAEQEFAVSHIPGSQFFDIDRIADLNAPLPHTLPSAEQFARQMGQLGIDKASHVIVYDNNHFFAAARVWWMFRVFGHDKVSVLDGGLSRWQALGFPLTSESSRPTNQTFHANFRPDLLVDLTQMQTIHRLASRQILDARSADSFNGLRPTGETGLPSGHIPGSVNIPYQRLYSAEQTLLAAERLREIFTAAGVDLTQPMVASCGSGVSAAVILLALYQLGIQDVPMYDGSWAEWSRTGTG